MKFTASQKSLLDCMSIVRSAIPTHPLIPAFGNVSFIVQGDNLILTGGNGEVRCDSNIKVTDSEEGISTVNAERLDSIIKAMPADKIMVSSKINNELSFASGTSEICMRGYAPKPYYNPNTDAEMQFSVPGNVLAKYLKSISYVPQYGAKSVFGINLAIQNKQAMYAATDGHRLAVCKGEIKEDGAASCNVPMESVGMIIKNFSDSSPVEVKIGESIIQLDNGKTFLESKLLESTFQNYERLLHCPHGLKLVFNKNEMLSALMLLKTVLDKDAFSVDLAIKDSTIHMYGQSELFGRAEQSVKCIDGSGELNISLNPDFIVEPCKSCDSETLTLLFDKPNTPVEMTDNNGFVCVFMPLVQKNEQTVNPQ